MKSLTIALLFISGIAFAQSDTLVTQTISYDTLITIQVVKKTTIEKNVNGTRMLDTPKEETVASEVLVFKDKNAARITKKSSQSSSVATTARPTQARKKIDRSRPPMVEKSKNNMGLGVSVVPSNEVESSEKVITPRASKMGYYAFPVIDEASRFANTITADDLKKHLNVLASDEYEGRETGQPGIQKAAQYIANHFQQLGLPDVGEEKTYFQKYPLSGQGWEKDGINISVDGKAYKYLEDFYSFPSSNKSREKFESNEVIFLGYGIDDPKYSDYKKANVKGKVALIYPDEPFKKDGTSYISGEEYPSEWTTKWQKKIEAARRHGVRTLLIIEPNVRLQTARFAYMLTEPNLMLGDTDPADSFSNSCYISPDIAKAIMGKKFDKVTNARDKIRDTGQPQSVKLKTNIAIEQKEKQSDIIAENVLGFIQGSDPEVNDELIVITAHYDHLGKRENDIFNGADDNGSGTSAVLEIAEAFATAQKAGEQPRRSILVMTVSGEEKGLLGSEYYANNPVFPLEKTVANLNVDMIGRVDENHLNPNYVYVIGADRISKELDKINKDMNEKYTKMELDYTFNAEDDPNRFYYRSDHYNFAEKGIPAAFFFSGVHEDYHQTTDTAEKLDYKKMERIARLVFLTAWELAEREERIKKSE